MIPFYVNNKKYRITAVAVLLACFLISYSDGFFKNTPLLKIDYMLVEKGKHKLTVYSNKKLQREYKIALGFSPQGNKEQEGDGKTPEGLYRISHKNPQSMAHLSLRISYPSKKDLTNGKLKGLTVGSNIMLHGIKNGYGWLGRYHTLKDWTKGCIAVTNKEIEEIYKAVDIGCAIEIRP